MWDYVFGGAGDEDDAEQEKEKTQATAHAGDDAASESSLFSWHDDEVPHDGAGRRTTVEEVALLFPEDEDDQLCELPELEEQRAAVTRAAMSIPEDEPWLSTTIEFGEAPPPLEEPAAPSGGAAADAVGEDAGAHECDRTVAAEDVFGFAANVAAAILGTSVGEEQAKADISVAKPAKGQDEDIASDDGLQEALRYASENGNAHKVVDAFGDRGDASRFDVRKGPDYLANGAKEASASAFYRCVSVDAVRSESHAVTEVLGRQAVPPAESGCDWRPTDKIPRVISTIMVLPFLVDNSLLGWSSNILGWGSSEDFGCSLVSVHVVEPETLQAARGSPEEMCPALRLFLKWIATREVAHGDKTTSGLLKFIALCENFADMAQDSRIISGLSRWNGTPALVTESGALRWDLSGAGEWLEILIDVRMWALAVRVAIDNLKAAIPRGVVQASLLVQGVEDDELPERILCTARIRGFNMDKSTAVLQPRPDVVESTHGDEAMANGQTSMAAELGLSTA